MVSNRVVDAILRLSIAYWVLTVQRCQNRHTVESKEARLPTRIRTVNFGFCSFSTASFDWRQRKLHKRRLVPTTSSLFLASSGHGADDNWRQNDINYSYNEYHYSNGESCGFRSKWNKQFHKAGGLLYKKSVLSPIEFQTIQTELNQLSLKFMDETTSSVAKNRIGAQLPYNSPVVQILANPQGSIYRTINDIAFSDSTSTEAKDPMILSTFIPVELRVYEKVGAGMDWHVDDVLYSPEQIEVVLTLENTSDCVTMWEDLDEKITAVETEANSAIFLKAGGVKHCVSSLKQGYRSILKFAFVRQNSNILDGSKQHTIQFSSSKKVSRNNKKKKKELSKKR